MEISAVEVNTMKKTEHRDGEWHRGLILDSGGQGGFSDEMIIDYLNINTT